MLDETWTAHGAMNCQFLSAALFLLPSLVLAQGGLKPERLFVRPELGDTLHLQMEQVLVVRPVRPENPVRQQTDGKSGTNPAVDALGLGIVSRFLLYAHSVVESSGSESILMVTSDSLKTWMAAPGDPGIVEWQPIPEPARLIRVRVGEDGSMRVNEDVPKGDYGGTSLPSWIPGLLSDKPVRVGAEWSRNIDLPLIRIGAYGAAVSALMRLRLDSLTHSGRFAWISMRGTLRQAPLSLRQVSGNTRVSGNMSGFMVLDRRRAWVTRAATQLAITMALPMPSLQQLPQQLPQPQSPPDSSLLTLDIRVIQQVRVR